MRMLRGDKMTIQDRVTVTQFELVRLCHQPAAADLVTMADICLRNAAGAITGRHSIDRKMKREG